MKISGSSVYQLAIIGGAAESITVMKSLKPLLTRVAILLSTFSCLAGEEPQKPMIELKKMNEVEAAAALMEAQSLDFQALIKIAADYGAAAEVNLYEMAEMLDENVDRWIVILGSHSTFEAAKQQAEDLAKKSKVPFTMKGMVYDAEGLHYPKDFEDEVYAGKSISRRGNATIIGEAEVDHFLSVEKSDDYKDFTPGRYIIVGNIAATAEEGARQVEAFKKVAPDAYAKVTKVFIGCDH